MVNFHEFSIATWIEYQDIPGRVHQWTMATLRSDEILQGNRLNISNPSLGSTRRWIPINSVCEVYITIMVCRIRAFLFEYKLLTMFVA